jgi:hypothetical protein
MIRNLLRDVGATVVVHGDAPHGADFMADQAAHQLQIPVQPHPAKWNQQGKKAGPLRNQEMIDAHPDTGLVLAFPLRGSVGTWDCVDRAEKAGLRIQIITLPEEPVCEDCGCDVDVPGLCLACSADRGTLPYGYP